MSKTISEWQKTVWKNAEDHGFHDKGANDNLPTQLTNIHGEVSEAWEEVRKVGFDAKKVWRTEKGKPEGFPTEMADIVIRCMDVCEQLGIDLEQAIAEKHAYNVTREFKHGKVC